MSFDINTNINAMMAQRNLSANSLAFGQSVERLSSGLRINSAADDAAGLAVSDKLEAQVNGLNQASRNAQDGISMLQTADGAMNEVTSMMQRMRELAVQASNDTLSTSDRQAIGSELTQLDSEIHDIGTQTQFNGKYLLNGNLSTSLASGSVVQSGFVVAAGTNTSVSNVDVSQAKASGTFTFANAAGKLTLSDGTTSQTVDLTSASIGAGGSYDLNFSQLGVKVSVSSVTGETGANVAAGLDAKTITTAAGTSSANLQVGANASDSMSVSFTNIDLQSATADASLKGLHTAIGTFNGVGGQTSTNAQALITAVDSALNYVDGQRANFGASQNRLQHTINNLGTTSQNLAASQSRIKDVDVASEMVNFTKEQILQQAGTAVLAQANQAPNVVLSLLR